jgi:hypothetical protein
MSAVKKKSETCEEQLRRMCKNIADGISQPADDHTTKKQERSVQRQPATGWKVRIRHTLHRGPGEALPGRGADGSRRRP